jgi:hypothetical protein
VGAGVNLTAEQQPTTGRPTHPISGPVQRTVTWTVRLGAVALALLLFETTLAAEAQQSSKVWRIGLLSSASRSAGEDRLLAFKHGLRALGYVEGQNLVLEYRWAEGITIAFQRSPQTWCGSGWTSS